MSLTYAAYLTSEPTAKVSGRDKNRVEMFESTDIQIHSLDFSKVLAHKDHPLCLDTVSLLPMQRQTWPLEFGFCVENILSILLSDFLSQFRIFVLIFSFVGNSNKYLKFKIRHIDELPSYMNLQVLYNCSAFSCSYFCVSFSRQRKSERTERKFKTQNPNLESRVANFLICCLELT